MKDDCDDSKSNPIKKELSISSTGEEIWLNEDVAKFIYKLSQKTELTSFTGNVIKKDTNEGKKYRFETFIYKNINYGRKYDSKKIFLEKQKIFGIFLNNMKKYFWDKGWKHGDLNPNNCVIYYIDKKPKFKIFNFEHTTKYEKELNTVGYFKFLWNKEIQSLYYNYVNNMGLNIIKNKCEWYVGFPIEQIYEDKMSECLYMVLKSNDDKNIDINKLLNYIISHLSDSIFINNVIGIIN